MSVFDDIYRENRWNGVESRSGPGSGRSATEAVVRELVALVDELNIGSVLDAACGDSFWMPSLPGYIGVDVASEAVELARRNHPDRVYLVGNVVEMRLPPFDLVIFRDVVQHLPLDVGVAAIVALRATGSQWLLASTFVGGENRDIEAGDAYAPDLTAMPFDLGQPDRLIFDGYGYRDSAVVRDSRKHLGLWALRKACRGTGNLTVRRPATLSPWPDRRVPPPRVNRPGRDGVTRWQGRGRGHRVRSGQRGSD